MIVEGYGKILGRPGLDLVRRELCVIAQVAVLGAPRQLRSHLKGALEAGAPPSEVDAAFAVIRADLEPRVWDRAQELWSRVRQRELGR